jgi:UPF0271 protein
MSHRVDLNCDLGEGFGPWVPTDDASMLEVATSTSLACGFHAGDPATMRHTVRLALDRGVAIGAHPSLPDLQGFGRRDMAITPQEAYELTLYQIGALYAFVQAAGGRLSHVKPHGALYHQAARDPQLADGVARAVRDFDPALLLFGLSGSELTAAGERAGLAVVHEAFADRAYQASGALVPRGQAGAVIADEEEVAAQVLDVVLEGRVRAASGEWIPLRADTICISGDHPGALSAARRIRSALEARGVTVAAPGNRR